MIPLPNVTVLTPINNAGEKGESERSQCILGIIPVIYYSVLLSLGLPVNILNALVLSRLAIKTQKSSYYYLLALTTSDILTQIFIVFVGFILQTAILHKEIPNILIHLVSILEFGTNHASIWITVPLTIDRYVALCHPLKYRTVSYPERSKKIIIIVFISSLTTGIPFYWWSDVWRENHPPTVLDKTLIWVHCFIIYFIPCTIFLVINSRIIYSFKQKKKSTGRTWHSGKTTAILLAITTVFAILWAPRTFIILYHLYVSSVYNDWRVHLVYDLANMLALLNTAVNFFLYCFVSKRFRAVVKEILQSCKAHYVPCNIKPQVQNFPDSTLKPLGLLDCTAL
ncbi:probable G-protein coupled receptor 142 [Protopterus annectens]|uniref:probable G-protein coupled receptor 142 n=1 Tax=Protopterus annectens TaxID=7888 RepID=UPI001CFB0973|nr:probable G-protein coupled receptor 142 [Protopterus annectens]XP_043940973.1 probable G-protein coupled receptor 142 [Protopterus annectens]